MSNTPDARKQLRQLPSVDKLLRLPAALDLEQQYGRALLTDALRQTLEQSRQAILDGRTHSPMPATLVQNAREWLEALLTPTLKPIINATGVILHTNLGRAPLSLAAMTTVHEIAAGYNTLEFDLESGRRGSRAIHAEQLLTRISGAEAAMVVNNNAAAVLLMLTILCQGKEVIISRGQLVEIGGGFRVPDVMAQSGAKLVEVGTTNRTHLRDYVNAITENSAAILVAHHSNYKIVGFTTEPSLAELAELTQRHEILLLFDQGSGALLNANRYGLEPEATVLDGVETGCDLVAFSGDKLLGGPQAGILVGQESLIHRLKKHPLARAVRADKMALAALSATLMPYLTGQAETEIPIWRMLAYSLAEIADKAQSWVNQLEDKRIAARVVDGFSTVGGGSLPGTELPTKMAAIQHPHVEQLAVRLRQRPLPVIARIQADELLIDPRTVLPGQEEELMQALLAATQ